MIAILDETFLLSVWLEVLIYGLYLALFSSSVYIIVRKRQYRTGPSKVMFCIMHVMFFLATIHIYANLYRMLNGYIWLRSAPGGPVAYFSDLAKWDHIAKDTIFATQSLIGDAFAIYRCWVVWQKNYHIIIIPVVLLLGSAISGYIVAWLFTTVSSASIFSPRLHSWITAFYSFCLSQNVITTSFIAYKIWRENRNNAIGTVKGGLGPILVACIIIESAAAYVAAVFILMILCVINNPAQYIVLEAITPTIGIVFTSITVRLALRTSSVGPTTTITTIGGTTIRGTNGGTNLPMQPPAMHINHNLTKDDDMERQWRERVLEH